MNLVMHATGAAAVVIMCAAALVGVAGERRFPRLTAIALLVLAMLSLATFAVGQYFKAVHG